MTPTKYNDYGIGEAVAKTGLTHKQLRYWESQKYIPEPERIVCGDRAYRRYTETHIKLLRLIKNFLDRGYSLEGAVRVARENVKSGGTENGNKKE